MVKNLEDDFLREPVIVLSENQSDKIARQARIYAGCTYGCLADEEVAVVYDGEDSFTGVNQEYIRYLR